MAEKGLLIQVDGTAELIEVETRAEGAISKVLDVEYIQAVFTGKNEAFYMDEEGKYNGLPVNPFATNLFYTCGGQLMPGDFLVGPVIVFGFRRGSEYDYDVPRRVLGDSLVKKAMGVVT